MLLCLTANHRTTSFELLDRLSRAADGTAEQLVASSAGVRGAIVLATCNRFEAYLDVDERADAVVEPAVEATIDAVERVTGLDAAELRDTLTVLGDADVTHHLFSVSAGLESLAIGEDQISGQVGRALERARLDGTSSSALEHLFQHATSTSRHVKAATSLGGAGRSLVRLALELASSRVPDWSDARVLVVGTGNYAATTIAALRDVGARDIRVFSATGRAVMFAARYGVAARDDLRSALADADVVITCTSHYTIGLDDVPTDARLLVIDLGLPRNVDPAIRSLADVELLDLEVIGLHAPLGLTAETDARRLVGDAADAYGAARQAAPGIVALRRHVEEVVAGEIARLRGAGTDERTVEALRHLAGVLLHQPSVRARELAAQGRSAEFERAVETLFDVRVDTAAELRDPAEDIRSA